jgi:hypothetical protein
MQQRALKSAFQLLKPAQRPERILEEWMSACGGKKVLSQRQQG